MLRLVQPHDGLVGIGEFGSGKGTHFAVGGQFGPCEQQFLVAILGVDGPSAIGAQAHRHIAPPHDGAVLGYHVAVVGTAKVKILERELFLRGRHEWQQQCDEQ